MLQNHKWVQAQVTSNESPQKGNIQDLTSAVLKGQLKTFDWYKDSIN